jgi:CHASE2 domain-containing sensor protein
MQLTWLRAVLLLAVVTLGSAATAAGCLPGLEAKSLDLRFLVRGERPAPPGVVVVAIDENSLREQKRRWPWPRSLVAQLVAHCKQAGAKVIGLDLLLSEADDDPASDEALARAVAEAGNVVLISKFDTTRGERYRETMLVRPREPFARGALGVGYSSFPLDGDGVVRRAIPVRRHGGELQSAFSVTVALAAMGVKLPSTVARRERDELVASGTPLRASLDGRGSFLIDFLGDAHQFPRVSAYRILNGSLEKDLLRGKVVLVGASFREAGDFWPTPYSVASSDQSAMAGIEIHANLVAMLLSGRSFTWPGPVSRAVFAAGVGIGAVFAALLALWLAARHRLPWWPLALVAILLPLLLYASAAQLAFGSDMILPLGMPLLFALIAGASTALLGSAASTSPPVVAEAVAVVAQQTAKGHAAPAGLQPPAGAKAKQPAQATRTGPPAGRPPLSRSDDAYSPTMDSRSSENVDRHPYTDDYQTGSDHETEPVSARFQFRRRIGAGGWGTVFEAFDSVLEERVAVKVMNPARAAQPGALERFRREVKLARKVTDAHVARVFDFVEEGGRCFISMEMLPGHSLREDLLREGAPEHLAAARIARDIALGLAAAHAAGVVHRDLKPENVMLVPGRGAVVMDFGIARHFDPGDPTGGGGETTTGAIVGTPAYMSPEQLQGLSVDGRSDLSAAEVAERLDRFLRRQLRVASGESHDTPNDTP